MVQRAFASPIPRRWRHRLGWYFGTQHQACNWEVGILSPVNACRILELRSATPVQCSHGQRVVECVGFLDGIDRITLRGLHTMRAWSHRKNLHILHNLHKSFIIFA